MKAAWIAPFVLALAATPALAADSSNNAQQQSQTQGNVSPNAINPGQGKQPDGHTDGSGNQQHTDDFSPSRTADADGNTDIGADTDAHTSADSDKSTDRGSSADSSAGADNDMDGDTDT